MNAHRKISRGKNETQKRISRDHACRHQQASAIARVPTGHHKASLYHLPIVRHCWRNSHHAGQWMDGAGVVGCFPSCWRGLLCVAEIEALQRLRCVWCQDPADSHAQRPAARTHALSRWCARFGGASTSATEQAGHFRACGHRGMAAVRYIWRYAVASRTCCPLAATWPTYTVGFFTSVPDAWAALLYA